MKSFKEYLTESKKVYEFKVKIAGDHTKDAVAAIKAGLAPFKVESCSAGKSTPIQEQQSEFPEHKNVSMTIYDVTTAYPATSLQIRDTVAARLGIMHSKIVVRSMAEEKEHAINHQHDEKTGKAVIGTEYENSNHQDLFGEKQKLNFLKELGKDRVELKQVTGYNDEILAKSAPKHDKETPGVQTETVATKSLYTKQVTLPKGVK